jgi:hypothetical protein
MTDTKINERKVPNPLYAAAGAGDLAYQQLRKLRGKVVELRPVVTDAVSEQRLRADLDRLRVVARRNAKAVVSSAQVAQERATKYYSKLVAHGEAVVRSARTPGNRRAVTAARDPQAPAPSVPDKATKRARPAAK